MVRMRRFLFLGIALSTFALNSCRSSQSLFSKGNVSYLEDTQEVAEIPIRVERNVIFLDVEIQGKQYNFLFDSGAPMVISEELAEKLECPVLMVGSVRDSQEKIRKQSYVRMPDFKVGNRVFKGLTALASDLKASAILNCLNLDGIIGANAMMLQYWDFSVADSLMRVSNSNRHWPEGKKYVIPFKLKSTRSPLIQLKVNNVDVPGITFDTGSGGILSFNKSMTSSFKPENAHFTSYGYLSGGLFGSAIDTAYEHMMTFNFPDTNLRVPIEQEQTKKGKLLGMGFLRDYHVFLDYPNRQILLMPKKAAPNPDVFPISPYYENSHVVIGMINSLMPDSLAHIKVGDTIVSVNGEPIPDSPEVSNYCGILGAFKADSIELEIKSKGHIRLQRKPIPIPEE